MPTELEELVEFMHHGNTQLRQIAVENLVGYSSSQPSIFKGETPIKDLKLLLKDYTPIAKNAITILINLSSDGEVVQSLISDDEFLKSLLLRLTSSTDPNADLMAMLLANLAKDDEIKKLLTLKRNVVKGLGDSANAMDQLMDCFVRGADGSYNKNANYDYLSYLFADVAKFKEGRDYFVKEQDYDHVIPISKLVVFTEHSSDIRRRGVASTIKNVAFDVESHPMLISEDEVDVLPYIMLPILGPEEYSDEESAAFPAALQLLPGSKRRDTDNSIITTHLETLMILTNTRLGRETLRTINVYPIVREAHLHVEDEEVRDACDRLVQVIMRDEEPDEEDEEMQLVPVA